MNKKTLWITTTAILLALLIVWQYIGTLIPVKMVSQLITGSLINMTLVVSVSMCGVWSGVALALISPVFAALIGMAPAIPQLIPVIMLGNLVIVVAMIGYKKFTTTAGFFAFGIIGAVLKFATLALIVNFLIIPLFVDKAPMAKQLATMFTFPQLITATIGVCLASVVNLRIKKSKLFN